jgi:hypothetical protein
MFSLAMFSPRTLKMHATDSIQQVISSIRTGAEHALHARLVELRPGFAGRTDQVSPEGLALIRGLLDVLVQAEAPEPMWSYRVSIGARLVLTVMDDPGAFDELSGRLGGPEAAGILRAVEEHLQAASESVTPPVASPIDARWGEVARALSTRTDDAGLEARLIADGLDWFRGVLAPYPRQIDLGEGEDPPFPLLIVGWDDPGLSICLDALPGEPVHAFDHQYGGYACLQARIIGVPLPLLEGQGDAIARLAAAWWETSGNAMSAPDLLEWSTALGMDLEAGCEALLTGRPPPHLGNFYGRPCLRLRARRAGWHRHLEICGPRDVLVDEGVPFLDEQAARLLSLGERLGLGPPRPFILWGNSD